MNRRAFLVIAGVGLAAALGAILIYRRPASQRPFNIRLGQDRCKRCGMIISRLEHAAGILLAGATDWDYYDDVGCFAKDYYKHKSGGATIQDAKVVDFKKKSPIDAKKAQYIVADPKKLWTPMSYGVVAVEDVEDARALAEAHGGVLKTFEELLEWAREKP
jgi:nitrous oxide reductase accessory protein NosL